MGNEEIEGLGGWLFLLGIGIVISPIFTIQQIYPLFSELFSSNAWTLLTTPGTNSYKPYFASVIIIELTANILLLLGSIYMIKLFFKKNSLFPKFFIAVLLVKLFISIADHISYKVFIANTTVKFMALMDDILIFLAFASVWTSYLLVSKRVENTFIH